MLPNLMKFLGVDNGYPLVRYRFLVDITAGGVPNLVDQEFQSVKGLSMKRTIGREGRFSTLMGDGDSGDLRTLTLTRAVYGGMSVLTEQQMAEGLKWNTKMLRYDMCISVVDPDNSPLLVWGVRNAYLSSWAWDDLDAGENKVLTETMEWQYSNLQFTPCSNYWKP